jgi:hypothetical protein
LTTDIDPAANADAEQASTGRASAGENGLDLPVSSTLWGAAVFGKDDGNALFDAGPIGTDAPTAPADSEPDWHPLPYTSVLVGAGTGHGLDEPVSGSALVELPIAAMEKPNAPSESQRTGDDLLVAALPDVLPLVQHRVPPVSAGPSGPDAWEAKPHPPAFDSAVTRDISATDVIVDRDGVTLVKVGALVEMLSGQFDLDELARIRSSDARLHYLPVDALQRAGIPVIYDRGNDTLNLDTGFAQANGSAQDSGGVGGDAGASSSGAIGNESLLATASVGFDSNPFLSSGDSPEAVSLRLQLNPSITRSDGRSSFRASGRVEHIEYLGEYESLQNFGADLTGRHRLNERLEANAAALFRSDILGTDLTNPLSTGGSVDPGVPVIPGGNDVTILGQRQRRTQYGADTGLAFIPGERDEIRWSLAWRSDRFGSEGLSDSDFFSQQLRYSRQINGDLTLGAIVDASIINFTNANFGDAQTVTPQALVVLSLSERLKATGSLGFALTRVETPVGDQTTRNFAGNLSLCYEAERSNLCLNGARQVLPSAIGGARVQTTAGLSYSLRLSERESLQLGGNYSTASQPLATIGNEFESVNAFARYERRLSERARLFVSGGYLDTSGNNAVNATNLQAVMGITINLGSGQ